MYQLATPNKSDYSILLEIWERSVRATHDFLKESDIIFFKQAIRQHNVFDLVDMTIVKDDNEIILGFMGLSADSVEMLFLDPSIIGKGIGTLLMKHALSNPAIKKVDVNEQNHGALRFYQKNGFEIKSRSALDGMGKPFPILHMELAG